MAPKTPAGLGTRGRRLWKALTGHGPSPAEREVALEACRTADRLDKLDALLRGDAEDWVRILPPREGEEELVLRIDGALSEARQQQTVLKQLVAAVRVPDAETGEKPQKRGTPRGAYRVRGAAPAERASARPRLAVFDETG